MNRERMGIVLGFILLATVIVVFANLIEGVI